MTLLSIAAPVHAQNFRVQQIEANEQVVTLHWNSPDETASYVLQQRSSLDSGDWQNVATRYDWPLAVNRWTVNRGTGASQFYRVVAETSLPVERGKLIHSKLLRSFSISDARNRLATAQLGSLPNSSVTHEVDLYRIVHETVDPLGTRTQASGALFLPKDHPGPLPLLSFQHGTETFEKWVPSQDDSWYFPQGLLFASDGYAVFMPDYLGLGESPGFQPYLHAKSEATAVVDGVRATRAFCQKNAVELNDQLFLSGFSQGGHATAAAHREIEQFHSDEFSVSASAPMAGPYDLTATVRNVVTNQNYPFPAYIVVILAAWIPIYSWDTTLEAMLAPPYNRTLAAKVTRRHKFFEISDVMAPSLLSALEPGLRAAVQDNPHHFFWQAIADNDLLDWAPKAPVRLYHCKGDEQVPFQNALTAQEAWTANSGCCVEVEDPGAPASLRHSPCYPPSLISAKAWFDGLRK